MLAGTRISRCGRLTYVVFGVLLASASTAGAQPEFEFEDEEPLHIPELRTTPRLMIGAGGGLGAADSDAEDFGLLGGISLNLYVGVQFHRRVAVLADVLSVTHFLPADGDNPGITGFLGFTTTVQTWITPILFVRTGGGIGGLYASTRQDDGYDHGPIGKLSIGGEVGHRPNSGIDLTVELSGGPSQYSDPTSPLYYSVAFVVAYHRNIPLAP